MRRADALAAYQDFSDRTSAKVRQLAFAAIGIVWVFRPTTGAHFPTTLARIAILAVIALALAFAQSLYGTVAWGAFHRRQELASVGSNVDFKAPAILNWPTNTLFALKTIALIGTYVALMIYLTHSLV